jgi:peptidoglycan hydrolase CwlO-like protein
MNQIIKAGLILILIVLGISGAVSCSSSPKTVVPADYDSTKAALAEAQTQVTSLQQQAQSLQNKISDLQKQVSDQSGSTGDIKQQYDALNAKYQQLSSQNTQNMATIIDLQAKYQTLKAAQDLAAAQAANITASNIAKSLLAAINKSRTDNGLAVFLGGTNIVTLAQNNCLAMAQAKSYVSVAGPYQEEFIAAGYSSVENLVNAAMAIWKSNTHWYQTNVLAVNAIYGTVAVYELDNIFYITYIGYNFP